MTNTMTIKQAVALASSPEKLETQSIETLEAVVSTISNSNDSRAKKRLDIVKAVLKNLKKSGANTEKIERIENSVKDKKRVVRPTRKATEVAEKKAEQATMNLDAEPTTKEPTKAELQAELKAKGIAYSAKATKAELQALLVAPKAETKAEPKAEESIFPNEHDGMIKADVKELAEAVLKHPYQVHAFVLEEGETTPTDFLVSYANSEIVILVDLTNVQNSVVVLEVKKHFKKGLMILEDTKCEYAFYKPSK